jgi:hypothetical protein
MRRTLLLKVFLGAWLASNAAWAHSDQRLPGGDPVRWHRASVDFVIDPSMFDGETMSDPVAVVRAASGVWRGIGHVPRFDVRVAPIGPVGYDGSARVNTSGIALYRRNFPQRLDRAVLALTLLTRNSVTGEIVDADIIVDAERNRFAQLSAEGMLGVPGAPNDYQNVITHEFGHVLGLVEDPGDPAATMFPSSQPGEVGKRALASVDRESAARAYAEAPSLVAEVTGGCGGARIAPALGGTGAFAWVALAWLVFASRRPRRQRAAMVAVALGLLALGTPSPRPQTSRWGLVLRSTTVRRGAVLTTRADVRTPTGIVRVERLGGRAGRLVQDVLDAPSGSALREGAVVALPEE